MMYGYGPGGGPQTDRAEQLLRERYARGELDRETFQQMMKDLREYRPKW
ncbi:MAG: SHOCT domain-containing protein [Kyrpidia sp.]|nr:SHOCT domain-containing protein [Kyrpidia sp.]